MIRLSPRLLLQTARAVATTGARTEQDLSPWCTPRGTSELDAETKPSPKSWDVSFVHHCGFWSHFDDERCVSSFPLLAATTISEMAWYAAWRGVLDDYPARGDIFFQYSLRRRRFVHVGIVDTVQHVGRYNAREPYFDLITIEGDTNGSGDLRGGRTMRLKRRLSYSQGDRFCRWASLEPAAQVIPEAAAAGAADVRRVA